MTSLGAIRAGRPQRGSMRAGVVQAGAPHSFLSANGRLHREVGAAPSVVCLRVMCESGRKGFGGGEDSKKKAKKQGGGGVRREDNKRAVAVKEGSRQLQNVLRSVDKVKSLLSLFFEGFFFCRSNCGNSFG